VVSEEDEHTVPSAAALKKLAAPRSSSSAMMDDACIDGQQRHAKPNSWNWAGDRSSVLATVSSTPAPSTPHALTECVAQAVSSMAATGDRDVLVRSKKTALRPMMVTPEGVRRKRICEMTQEEQGRVRESNRDNARRNRVVVRQHRDSERNRLDLLNQRHNALQVQVDSWKKRLLELRSIAEERLSPQRATEVSSTPCFPILH
jgi:hypothetical protein